MSQSSENQHVMPPANSSHDYVHADVIATVPRPHPAAAGAQQAAHPVYGAPAQGPPDYYDPPPQTYTSGPGHQSSYSYLGYPPQPQGSCCQPYPYPQGTCPPYPGQQQQKYPQQLYPHPSYQHPQPPYAYNPHPQYPPNHHHPQRQQHLQQQQQQQRQPGEPEDEEPSLFFKILCWSPFGCCFDCCKPKGKYGVSDFTAGSVACAACCLSMIPVPDPQPCAECHGKTEGHTTYCSRCQYRRDQAGWADYEARKARAA